MMTLYDFGYLHSAAERVIKELIALRIPLVDIRFHADSRNHRYTQEGFTGRRGVIYRHIPDLGNTLYKEALSGRFTEPLINLADPDRGLIVLGGILAQHNRCAVFCACSSRTNCHRMEVVRLAREKFGCEIVHLPIGGRKVADGDADGGHYQESALF